MSSVGLQHKFRNFTRKVRQLLEEIRNNSPMEIRPVSTYNT